jgi:hypothetical protein
MKKIDVSIVDTDANRCVRINDGEFQGLIVSFDRVRFIPIGDTFKLSFNYNVVEGDDTDYNKKRLENTLGDILLNLIDEECKKSTIVFKGGVDEN